HGARVRAEPRAPGARLSRSRPQQDDGEAHPRAHALRRAVPGDHGAEPRHRVLLALSAAESLQTRKSFGLTMRRPYSASPIALRTDAPRLRFIACLRATT